MMTNCRLNNMKYKPRYPTALWALALWAQMALWALALWARVALWALALWARVGFKATTTSETFLVVFEPW